MRIAALLAEEYPVEFYPKNVYQTNKTDMEDRNHLKFAARM